MSEKVRVNEKTDGGNKIISFEEPLTIGVSLEGTSDLLYHRWNCEVVDEKSKSAKNSKSKKFDDVESYVWRNDEGELCIPSEYVRMSIIHAAKYRQDPRSPRKSASDLFKAGVVSLEPLSSLGVKDWDYLDKRRVTIQRAGINRTRPAMKKGWKADFVFQILSPEYIDVHFFGEVLTMAGRLVGIGDFRPTYGRFLITKLERLS